MNLDKVREFMRQPFAPFEIRTSEGRVYTVDHPEFLKLYRHDQAVNYTTDDDRDIIISADDIVALEIVNTRVA